MGNRVKKKQTVLLVVVLVLVVAGISVATGDGNIPSNAFVALGNLFFQEGNELAARDLFGQAVAADDNAVAHHNLGVLHYEAGRVDDAIEELELAIAADPTYAQAYNSLGLIQFEQGQLRDAEASFREALQYEESAQMHYDLAISIANRVRDEGGDSSELREAVDHFEAAERLEPGYERAAENIGVLNNIIEAAES